MKYIYFISLFSLILGALEGSMSRVLAQSIYIPLDNLIVSSESSSDINWNIDDQVEKLSLPHKKANLSLKQGSVQQNNKLLIEQGVILEVLETRFEQIPDSIIEQVNQVQNPLLLKQLYQVAEITSSLEKFQQILPSMVVNSEQTTIILTTDLAINEQNNIKGTAEALQGRDFNRGKRMR